MKKVAAVVVTYNRKNLLLENAQSLLGQTFSDVQIIIVDNNSSDGTQDVLQQFIERKQILYFNTGANLGGAGGFSYGIRLAAEAGYEYIWVMDDDCIPQETALEVLMEKDQKMEGKYGFLSSKVLWKDLSICNMNIQRETLTRKVKDFDHKLIPAVMASFVSLFLKAAVVKEVGLPIKDFFIWTDDWEYTRRISRRYPCYVVPESVVVHKSMSNIGANIYNDSYERLERYRYLYRNDVYLYRREGLRGFLYEFFRLNGHIIKVLLRAENYKWKRIQIIVGATISGFKFRPAIEYIDRK